MSTPSRATDERSPTSTADDERPAVESAGGRAAGFATGLRGGVLATLVMSAFRAPISRSPPPTAWFWAKFLGDGDPGDYVGRGFLLHLLYGAVGGGVFGAMLGPYIDGPESERELRGTLLGLGYGLFLSGFGVIVLLDRLLDLDLEADEKFVFHVSHVVYGLALGTWFGSRN